MRYLLFFFFVQMAQELYDESEDHFARMKTSADKAAKDVFLGELLGLKGVDTNDDDQIRRIIDALNLNIEKTNSEYVKSLGH